MKDSFDQNASLVPPASSIKNEVSRASVQRQVRAERKRSQDSPVALFDETLAATFDNVTVQAILDALTHLQLPLPEHNVEFIRAYEGAIFCSNDYGMVVRIEPVDTALKMNVLRNREISRIDDNPWILQPIGSITAGSAVIEICPGVHTTDRNRDLDVLDDGLRDTGACFYDLSSSNAGRLPLKTPAFPDGIPVVIDRLAVKRLSAKTRKIRHALTKMQLAASPQQTLYADLQAKFRDAWPPGVATPDAAKMHNFWHAMRDAKDKGILVAGWNANIDDTYKIIDARLSAVAYDQRLRRHFKAVAQNIKRPTGAGLRTSSTPKPGKK